VAMPVAISGPAQRIRFKLQKPSVARFLSASNRRNRSWAACCATLLVGQHAQDAVGYLGRLKSDEHVAGITNELKPRASSGIQDTLVDGFGAPDWNKGILLAVKEYGRASNIGGGTQQLVGRSTQGNVYHAHKDFRAEREQRKLVVEPFRRDRLGRKDVLHHAVKDAAAQPMKTPGAKKPANEPHERGGSRCRE
jgi:hypothetical protein